MEISKHASLHEVTYNAGYVRDGIDNTPTAEHIQQMKITANAIFEHVREFAGVPLSISMYRSLAVEKARGRSGTSQHCKGEAMDLNGKGKFPNSKIFQFIKENLVFDQMINEYPVNGEPTWVHVSYVTGNNRGQILTCQKVNGKTVYTHYKKGDCNEMD
jgi:zinc D-Ala-D-Ala carboxypeptidase